jgi:hypothetical protein
MRGRMQLSWAQGVKFFSAIKAAIKRNPILGGWLMSTLGIITMTGLLIALASIAPPVGGFFAALLLPALAKMAGLSMLAGLSVTSAAATTISLIGAAAVLVDGILSGIAKVISLSVMFAKERRANKKFEKLDSDTVSLDEALVDRLQMKSSALAFAPPQPVINLLIPSDKEKKPVIERNLIEPISLSIGAKEPSKREKELLQELGFDLREMELLGGNYYIKIPKNPNICCFYTSISSGKKLTTVEYNGIPVFSCAFEDKYSLGLPDFYSFAIFPGAVEKALAKPADIKTNANSKNSLRF